MKKQCFVGKSIIYNYKQIRLARALKAGDHLPTVRQLAGEIGVNPMTVSKAYSLLKEEGMIVMDRRHGAQVNRLRVRENALNADFDQRAVF